MKSRKNITMHHIIAMLIDLQMEIFVILMPVSHPELQV